MTYKILSKTGDKGGVLKRCLVPYLDAGEVAVPEKHSLLLKLSEAVDRCDVVFVLWNLNDPVLNISKILAKAVGLPLLQAGASEFADDSSPAAFFLPQGAVAFIDHDANIFGYYLESGNQSIIVLTDQREALAFAAENFILPFCREKYPPAAQPLGGAKIAAVLPERLPDPPAQERDQPQTAGSAAPHELTEESEHTADFAVPDLPDPLWGDEPSGKHEHKKVPVALKIVTIIMALVMLATAGFISYDKVIAGIQCDSSYRSLRKLCGEDASGEIPFEILSKYGALYEKNKDFAGWLEVPNTEINYPVAKSDLGGANFYQNHLFGGAFSKYGTPYLSDKVDLAAFSYNTVIYGANYDDSRMFSTLEDYLSTDFYQSAPVLNFDSVYAEAQWKIFAVMLVDSQPKNDQFDCTDDSFFDDSEFLDFVSSVKNRSILNTRVEVDENDTLLTLVTDYPKLSGIRIAVVARKLRDGESKTADPDTSVNSAIIFPDIWYEQNGFETLDPPLQKEIASASETVAADAQPYEPEPVLPSLDSSVSSSEASSSLAQSSSQSSAFAASSKAVSSAASSKSASKTISSKTVSSKASSSKAASSKAVSSKKPSSSAAVSSKPDSDTATLPKLTVTNQSTGTVVKDTALNIVSMVVEAEMGSCFEPEALKAQAVATYTWLLNEKADSTKAPPVPIKTALSASRSATGAVLGQVVRYNGTRAYAYYSAMSAGKTSNSGDVWKTSYPYLVSVDSSVDKSVSDFQTIRTYKAADVAAWAKAQYNVDLTQVSDKTKWFSVTYDSNKLYAKTVSLGGLTTVSGLSIRQSLFVSSRVGSANVLRSHAFTIVYSPSDDKFTFTVKGFGHGVGMSQRGANAYAKNGWSYLEILSHYFKGTTVG